MTVKKKARTMKTNIMAPKTASQKKTSFPVSTQDSYINVKKTMAKGGYNR